MNAVIPLLIFSLPARQHHYSSSLYQATNQHHKIVCTSSQKLVLCSKYFMKT